jgi:hypothetical protein
MGAAIAVAVGYLLGARAGQQGYAELVDAWQTIRESDEVKDLLRSGMEVAKELIGRGLELVSSSTRQGSSLQPAA